MSTPVTELHELFQKEAGFTSPLASKVTSKVMGSALFQGTKKGLQAGAAKIPSLVQPALSKVPAPVKDFAAKKLSKEGLKSGARTLAGVKPGDAAFSRPRHYVTRPLRAALFPNLGKWGNRARVGSGLGFGGYLGYQGHRVLGEAAEGMNAAATYENLQQGSPGAVSALRQYGTRTGILKGLLRGAKNKAVRAVSGAEDVGGDFQEKADRFVNETTVDLLRDKMIGAKDSVIKPHEVMNPITSFLLRTGVSSGGKEVDQSKFRQRLKELMSEYHTQRNKEDFGDVSASRAYERTKV